MTEKVLVHKLPVFEKEEERLAYMRALLQSLISDKAKQKPSMFTEYSFEDREKVEFDDNYVQINYGVMLCKKVGDTNYIFANKKIKNSSEKRLMGRVNIFIGGHCNEVDMHSSAPPTDIVSILEANREREFVEEVELIGIRREDFKLLKTDCIYITDEEVSKHHACIYDVYQLPVHAHIKIKETDKLEGSFIALEQLIEDPSLDNWSTDALTSNLF